jgi:hypothetical protein
MTRKIFKLAVALVLVFSALPLLASAESAPASPSPDVIISEIKLGGAGSPTEFVELFNTTTNEIDVSGWTLERAEPGFGSDDCDVYPWPYTDSERKVDEYELSGTINFMSAAYFELPSDSLFNGEGSSLRLTEPASSEHSSPIVHDLVGWGKSAPCYLGKHASIPRSGKSLQRIWECGSEQPKNTFFNKSDFIIKSSPSPGIPTPNSCSNPCDGFILSEIGANLTDDQQFIEIFNPTGGQINLEGCRLMTNRSNTKFYSFGNRTLDPGKYRVIFINNTELDLTKGTSGTVYIVSPDGESDVSEQFYQNLKQDTSWTWFGDDDWRQTYHPSPGEANTYEQFALCPAGKERNPDTGLCRNVGFGGSDLKPCRPDQFRNPLTNRCKLKDDGSGLKPCRPDQFRNTETNRCKLISSASSSLKPCNGDQFRNPATNRCKKIDSGDSLKPCDPDQERNPETNRCRKVRGAASGNLPKVEDVEAPVISGGYSWLLAGIAGGGVFAYAGWEWRRELLSLISGLKGKLPF